jgi:hypothetical protein
MSIYPLRPERRQIPAGPDRSTARVSISDDHGSLELRADAWRSANLRRLMLAT